MTIHGDHPFLAAEPERDPVRRFRGRLVQPVTAWTALHEGRPAGLTVGSVTVADGDPACVLGLVDPESDLWTAASGSGRFAVAVLAWGDRTLADVLGGLGPSAGPVFDDRAVNPAGWTATRWGPVPTGRTWAGCALVDAREVGYGWLVTGAVEQVELAPADDPVGAAGGVPASAPSAGAALARVRGRYAGVVPRR